MCAMSISFDKIAEIKQWLNSRHAIVPTEWIEACVSFLVQEYRDPSMPVQRLKTHVYEQWLAADFTEIGVSTLPPEMSVCQKMSLNGVYALQVNGIRDVGRPAYAQLRQLEGRINTDLEVSAAPKAALPEWESKPTRMLMLNLTDGVSCIQGMEYKPISSLSPNLPPGVKILVKGPLECRFGMLLLTATNIEVLGGEVEKYLEKYSREEMLREALHQGSTQDGQMSRTPTNEVIQEQQQFPRNNSNFFNNHRTVQQTFHNPGTTTATITASENSLRAPEIPETFDDDDDFMQDLDYSVLDEIERVNSQQSPSNLKNSQKPCQNSDLSQSDEMKESGGSNNCLDTKSYGLVSEKCSSNTVTTLDSLPRIEYIKKEFTVIIKGSVSKVLSKLECKAVGGWHLTARVSDSTSHIDVDFHDEVLQKFVGISAKEMMAMQTEAFGNRRVKEQVTQAITNFKKKLQKLNCLMEVKFTPCGIPCVIKCFDE